MAIRRSRKAMRTMGYLGLIENPAAQTQDSQMGEMVAVGRGNVFGRLPGSSQLGCQKCHLVFHAGQRQLQLRVLVL
eukprot:CAMPEP_0114279842 /NCGR_PEP_ID=MMETSP0059-20121206/2114_1 /TAXON_ID=36894 /ORGANISM="Pyramimonas parkeae, Strain CCMP726" /LENGTH=75 /DNA_ID=CAMNT_0001400191 /DNA_START=424 /DNA_END=652 /DNA_ORIENTATION=-